jgi:two-component system, sensor histidine kinase and response regulator
MLPKQLARQLRKKLGVPDFGSIQHASEHLSSLSLEQKVEIADKLPSLLQGVAESYDAYERDLELRTRSLELSSSELMLANAQLRKESETQQAALESLKRTLCELLARDTATAGQNLDIRELS